MAETASCGCSGAGRFGRQSHLKVNLNVNSAAVSRERHGSGAGRQLCFVFRLDMDDDPRRGVLGLQ
jgi:hypothetical protein